MGQKGIFEPLPAEVNFFALEEEILRFWQKNKVFEKSIEQRPADKLYVFYDGPPFITGLPHHGHLLTSIAKDVIPRFWTMKGWRVPRRWGWDCHGLPSETQVEKQLGIRSRREILTKVGVRRFVEACYAYVQNVSSEWEWYINHIGRWVDFKNAYKTMDRDYMETVIWVFAQLYKKGLIYKGVRTSLYCPRCVTPLSNFEIAMDNSYQLVSDPAVTVIFELTSAARKKLGLDKPAAFLAWTTTPWTLPANRALAVQPKATYVLVEVKGEKRLYLLAKARLQAVLKGRQWRVLAQFVGLRLVGLEYHPLFDFYPKQTTADYQVHPADFVSLEEGTGVVHIAPGFGEEDFEAGKRWGLSLVNHVDEEGRIDKRVTPFAGLSVFAANEKIIANLQRRNLLFSKGVVRHRYPFCYRCGTPLIYKAQDAWFLRIEAIRSRLLETNKLINWIPGHLKFGRFQQGIKTAPDWCLSRSRFWATPIPVWECQCGWRWVPESIAEIESRSGQKVDDLHRPWIDKITVDCPRCGKKVRRVPEVLDCWFESGAMPYGERHYPFENKAEFERSFPADFVVEYIAQTRGWFYTLHVLATALFNQPAFKNVVTTGVILGTDGRKMSKSLGNYPDPKLVVERYGADAFRLYLMGSAVMTGADICINEKEIAAQIRQILLPWWNCCRYFVTYANLHQFVPQSRSTNWRPKNLLDRWIVARVNLFTREFDYWLSRYRIPKATRLLVPFLDDLSRWYIRLSRPRFVAGEKEALQTLWQVLVQLLTTVAPLTPFLTEYLWQKLVRAAEKKAKISIHLEDYPQPKRVERQLLVKMAWVRQVCELGHSERKKAGIKTRQPLAKITIWAAKQEWDKLNQEWTALIAQELNVKRVIFKEGKKGKLAVVLDTKMTPALRAEGEARELIRQIQMLRQKQGLRLDERIIVWAPYWPKDWEGEIKTRVGAVALRPGKKLRIQKYEAELCS